MCGIAGIVDTRGGTFNTTTAVHRMCDTIIHRGPDEEGLMTDGPVALGMRRLSIIDLTGGQQPIHNEDRSVWVVFNGEIYNFPELRDQLEKSGHRFYTHSDTEVIVHLYEQYGIDCVEKLRGMFAFACYDKNNRRLLIARDRLGKKPLHYGFSGDKFLFGSEIKELLEVAPELLEVEPSSTMRYFQFGYIPDPYTAFKNVHKLPPGHLAVLENGVLNVRPYWDVPAFMADTMDSEEEILEKLEAEIAQSVKIRLISDVPLGAFLSGGVDSSIVVALMARASSRPVKTFSIAFGNKDFNESKYAKAVAERFGTEHHEMSVEPNILDTLDMLTRLLEEPFADSSMIPTYHVSRLTRKHVTVALSGDGGDELFGGYDRYAIALRRKMFDAIPGWMGQLYRRSVYPNLPHVVAGRKFAYNVTLASRDRYIDSVSFLSLRDGDQPIFSRDFLEATRRWPDSRQQFQGYFDEAPAKDLLSKLQYLDVKTYLAGDILTKVDRMSMATSLEVRAPLLDHMVVERSTRIPARLKSDGKRQKYILKKLAERLGIPGSVLHRPKQGFAIPLVHWLRNELKELVTTILTEPRAVQRGYFNKQGIQALLDEHFTKRRDHSALIWLLLVFELWHRNFLEARSASHAQVDRALAGVELR